jgi:diguanylate cyclase (GGDEF)-like protein
VGLVFVLVGVVIGVVASQLWRVFGHRGTNHPRDALTGLPLRAAAHDALRDLRAGDAVVMLDLDELKRVNDTRGHTAGDDLLTAVADHLAHGVRAGDIVTRWGGDEFVIVLRGGGPAAGHVVERLRASAPTSFSAGIAVHDAGEGAATLARADAALLAAKRAGGQRVMTG